MYIFVRVACVDGNDGLGGEGGCFPCACVRKISLGGGCVGGGVYSMELKPSSVFLRHNAGVNWRPRVMVEIHYDSVVRRMCDHEYERLAYGWTSIHMQCSLNIESLEDVDSRLLWNVGVALARIRGSTHLLRHLWPTAFCPILSK